MRQLGNPFKFVSALLPSMHASRILHRDNALRSKASAETSSKIVSIRNFSKCATWASGISVKRQVPVVATASLRKTCFTPRLRRRAARRVSAICGRPIPRAALDDALSIQATLPVARRFSEMTYSAPNTGGRVQRRLPFKSLKLKRQTCQRHRSPF